MRGNTDFSWLSSVRTEQLPLRIAYDGPNVSSGLLPDRSADVTIVCGFLGCDLQRTFRRMPVRSRPIFVLFFDLKRQRDVRLYRRQRAPEVLLDAL